MQPELPLKRFTKKQIALILTTASMLGLISAFVLTLIPTPLEAKAIEILENQTMWHEYQSEIEARELEILKFKMLQEDLENRTDELRNQIELTFQ